MALVFLFAAIVCLIGLQWIWTRRYFYMLSFKMPGPKGFPFIGSAYQLRKKDELLQRLEDYCKKYGDPYFIWLGVYPVVVISDPSLAKDILTSSHCVNKSLIYTVLDDTIGKGLISVPDPQWSLERRALNSSFGNKILNNFMPLFNDQAEELVEKLCFYIDGAAINLVPIMQTYTLKMATKTMMGYMHQDVTERVNLDLLHNYHNVLDNMTNMIFAPWLRIAFIRQWLGIQQLLSGARQNINHFIKELIETKMNSTKVSSDTSEMPLTNGGHYFMDIVIDLLRKGVFSWQNVEIECNTIILAAFETTANAILNTLILLAMHPECQEKLYEEVKSVFADDENKNMPLNLEHLQDLVYLEMVINESMRVLTPVPLVARQTTRQVTLGNGLVLPARLQVAINIFHIHRDPNIWGDGAHLFNPDNFMPSNMADKYPYAFMPFTKGIRNCIGWRQAVLFTKVTLIKLLMNYRFTTDFHFEDLKFVEDITLKLKELPLLGIKRR